MYHVLREIYWWEGFKRDIGEFVSKSPNCQQVKAGHQKLGGLLQEIQIPTWKWEYINMYVVVGLPRTQKSYNSIWVVMDQLTKSARFIPVKSTYSTGHYTRIFIDEIVCPHCIPLSIILYWGVQFTSRVWICFQKGLGTTAKLSTAFHPQMDGQAECTIQTLEDMLRACIIDCKGNWDTHLPLVEFAYIIVFIHPFP